MYVYYPSCSFQRIFPETAGRIRTYLNTQEDVKIAGCCHKTSSLPQTGDTIVTICMSCMRGLSETRPDLPVIGLFEFLLGREDFVWPDLGGEEIMLQDCFRARGKHELQDAVRTCLRRANVVPVEMDHNRDEEDFDGPFKLRMPSPVISKEAPHYFTEYLPQHLTVRPEEEWDEVFRAQVSRYTTKRAVCYCNTCYTGMKRGGADAVHLAEVLFPE